MPEVFNKDTPTGVADNFLEAERKRKLNRMRILLQYINFSFLTYLEFAINFTCKISEKCHTLNKKIFVSDCVFKNIIQDYYFRYHIN